MARRKSELAIYGNVALYRMRCEACGETSLVVKGKTACCGEEAKKPDECKRKRHSSPDGSRQIRIPKKVKEQILKDQNNGCFYCGAQFGSTYWDGKKFRSVRLNWDHLVPFAYSHSSNCDYVAACRKCNQIKGAKIFDTIEEAQIYILEKRGMNGEVENIRRMQAMQSEVSAEAEAPDVLQAEMPGSVPPPQKEGDSATGYEAGEKWCRCGVCLNCYRRRTQVGARMISGEDLTEKPEVNEDIDMDGPEMVVID